MNYLNKKIIAAVAFAIIFSSFNTLSAQVIAHTGGLWGRITFSVDASVFLDPFIYFEEGDYVAETGTGKSHRSWEYCQNNRTAMYDRTLNESTNKWEWVIILRLFTYADFFGLTPLERFQTTGFTVFVGETFEDDEFQPQEYTSKKFIAKGDDEFFRAAGDITSANGFAWASSNVDHDVCPITGEVNLPVINVAEPIKMNFWTMYPENFSNIRFKGVNNMYQTPAATAPQLELIFDGDVPVQGGTRRLVCYEGVFDYLAIAQDAGINLETQFNNMSNKNQAVRVHLNRLVTNPATNAEVGRNQWITFDFKELDSCHIIQQDTEVGLGNEFTFSAVGLTNDGREITSGINFGFEMAGETTNTITSNGVFTANESGVFIVKCTAWQNYSQIIAEGYATVTVTSAGTMDNVSINPENVPLLQFGSTQQFTAKGFADGALLGSAGLTTLWSVVEETANTINQNGLFTALEEGTFTVQADITQISEGITLTATVQITVADLMLAAVEISPSPAQIEFLGGTQQFIATAKNRFGGVITENITFEWSIDRQEETSNTIDQEGLFTGNELGFFRVACIARQGEIKKEASAQIVVQNDVLYSVEIAQMPAENIYVGNAVNFTAIAKNGAGSEITEGITFLWVVMEEGANIHYQNGLFKATEEGIYTIICTAFQGALSAKDTAQISVISTGLNETESGKYSIYPNPVTDILNIKGLEKDADIRIIDAAGRVLITQKTSGTINISQLAQGLYIMFVEESVIRFMKK